MLIKKFLVLIISFILIHENLAYARQSVHNSVLDTLKNIKDQKELNTRLRSLFDGSEKDMLFLLVYYKNSPKLTDSVIQAAIKRFPKGKIAFTVRYGNAINEKDPVVQEQLIQILKEDYPDLDVEQLNIVLSNNYANAKNTAKALWYLERLDKASQKANLSKILKSIIIYDADAAEAFIEKELKKDNYSSENRLSLLEIYGYVLIRKGNFQKAFTVLKEAYNQTPQKTPELRCAYYYLLSKTGGYREAFPELEQIVLDGLADKKLKDELKRAYAILYPKRNVDKYVSNLEKGFESKLKKKIYDRMIKESCPNFAVKDIQDTIVSLTDLKGKIIVLDFWATWCIPCKRSLPEMQMVVDKYKNDHNVVFLFIHTLEDVPDPKIPALKYFKDNKFRLPLFFDLRDPNTKKCLAVSALKIQGIPAKFVIDGQGNIRFKVTGFENGNKNAVSEISTMIDLTKEASN